MNDIPYLAIGNSEPIPDGLPDELLAIIREGRYKAGWCDHGNKLGECPKGCNHDNG
jgi:hypothetical protein